MSKEKPVTAGDMVRCFSQVKPHVPVILNIRGKRKDPWAKITRLFHNETGPRAGTITIFAEQKYLIKL